MFAECEDMKDHRRSASGQVRAHAERTVTFLSAIESTINTVVFATKIVQTINAEFGPLLEIVDAYDADLPLDPDGDAGLKLERGAQVAWRLYVENRAKLKAWEDDERVDDDDGVTDAFVQYIAALADMHNGLEELRDRIAIVDALKSPRGKKYSTAEGMFADLGI